MVDDTLCLERTGTGIVFREASRPDGMLAGWSGFGFGSDMRTGVGTPTGFMDGCPFPCELEDEMWWDEGLVQDFPHVGRDPSMCNQCW